MSVDAYQFPDPLVTANLYGAGRVDEILERCIALLREEMMRLDSGGSTYLWTMRYARGGEHLKVRLHGPPALEPDLRDALVRTAERFLASLGEPAAPAVFAAPEGQEVPPIDPEDEAAQGHPDRSLLLTTYRRSQISLGGGPFLRDDRYVAIVTRALGEGCEMALSTLQAGANGQVSFRARQTALLKAIIGALAATRWPPDKRVAYLAYHRNWLIRYLLARSRQGAERAAELLAQFARNVASMAGLQAIERVVATQWSTESAQGQGARSPEAAQTPAPGDAWHCEIDDLVRHVPTLADQPDFLVDPFALDPAFPAVFKVLHGLANQLGLTPINESFAHHLILHVAGGGQAGFENEPPTTLLRPPVE